MRINVGRVLVIYGDQWVCPCGWSNVFVRKSCRNCGGSVADKVADQPAGAVIDTVASGPVGDPEIARLRAALAECASALAGYRREMAMLTGQPDDQPCDAERKAVALTLAPDAEALRPT